MKVTTLKKSVLLTIACAGIGLAPSARAEHATTFLDNLLGDVTNRLAVVDSNTPAAERQALTSAQSILNRNSKTPAADAGVLASASTVLDARFTNDATFTAEETDALNSFNGEAQNQLAAVNDLIGTNGTPRPLSNQLSQAQGALDRANNESNSIPIRARAMALALNKIRVANIIASHGSK